MNPFEVEGWTTYEAAGGERSYYLELLPGGDQPFDVEKRDRFTYFVSPFYAERITLRDVQQCTDNFGTVTEWCVDYKRDGVTESGQEFVEISCISAFEDILRNTGLVRELSGEHHYFNIGGVGITPTQYLQAFIVDSLTDYGTTFVSVGTVDFTAVLDQAFEGECHLEAARHLAKATGGELEWLRPSGSSYTLGLRTAIGDQSKQIEVTTDKNLRRMSREIELGDMATVLVPLGVRTSDQERAGPGNATWKVSQIDSAVITLVDPLGGDGPIAFAIQLNGMFVKKRNQAAMQESGDPADLFLTEILQSNTDGTVVVRNEDGIAVGDYVEICLDENRTRVSELENPAAAASTSYRRLCRKFERDNLRGERNYVRNPLFNNAWSSAPEAHPLQIDGNQVGVTSIDVKNLPADQPIKAGDVVTINDGGSGDENANLTVQSDTTADGSGNATIAINGTVTFSDNQGGLLHHYNAGANDPDGWDRGDDESATPMRSAKGGPESTTCQADGAQTVGGTSLPTLDVKGLTAFQDIKAGTIVDPSTDADYGLVAEDAQADGSGDATLVLHMRGAQQIAVSDNDDIDLIFPDLGTGESGYAISSYKCAVPAGVTDQAYSRQVLTVHFDQAYPTLYVSAHYTAISLGQGWTGGSSTQAPPRLQFLNSGGSELAGVNGSNWSPSALDELEETIRTSYTMTVDLEDAELRWRWPYTTGSLQENTHVVYLRSVMVHLGPDEVVEHVDGSHGNELWQLANDRLGVLSVEPVSYEMSWSDLSVIDGIDADQPELGSWVHLVVPEQSIDVVGRIVALTLFPTAPLETRVVIDTRPDLASRKVQEKDAPPVFAAVQITAPAEGEVVKAVTATSTTPPARTDGALRFFGSTSSYKAYSEA